jgi:hypothetical protein
MAAMTDMNEATKLRQVLGVNAAAMKVALMMTVSFAGLYLWKHTSVHLGMLCA